MTSTHHHTPRLRLSRLPILVLMVLGCVADPTAPLSLPAGAVPMPPGAHYQEWWDRTEACSGLSGDLTGLEWYVVPDASIIETDIGRKVGLWIRQGGRRAVVLAGAYMDHELVVRHEMLHDLLSAAGHPETYFEARCGLTWDAWGRGEDS